MRWKWWLNLHLLHWNQTKITQKFKLKKQKPKLTQKSLNPESLRKSIKKNLIKNQKVHLSSQINQKKKSKILYWATKNRKSLHKHSSKLLGHSSKSQSLLKQNPQLHRKVKQDQIKPLINEIQTKEHKLNLYNNLYHSNFIKPINHNSTNKSTILLIPLINTFNHNRVKNNKLHSSMNSDFVKIWQRKLLSLKK